MLDDPATLRADNLPGKGQGKMLGGHEMDIDGTIPESVDGMSAAPFGNFARPISRAISITTPVMKPADVGQIVDISDEMIRPQTVKRNKESHEPLEHVISHLKAQPCTEEPLTLKDQC